MKYAIIASGGKQYKVEEGQTILVDKLEADKGKPYTFDKVLLARNDDEILIGNPYIASVKVSGKVLDQIKGDKLTISKFKAKVHYRRRIGFRPLYSKILIESVSFGKVAAPKKGKTSKKS